MNKAFVRDDAEAPEDDDPADNVETAIPGGKNYITQQGYKALRDELAHLLDVDRPEVVQVVSWAASNGDRSENGDYIYGKRRLREIDRRIRFLTRRLDKAEVVDPSAHRGNDQIFFGAHVTYREFAGTIHGFCSYRKLIPSAQADLTAILGLARTMIAEAGQSGPGL